MKRDIMVANFHSILTQIVPPQTAAVAFPYETQVPLIMCDITVALPQRSHKQICSLIWQIFDLVILFDC